MPRAATRVRGRWARRTGRTRPGARRSRRSSRPKKQYFYEGSILAIEWTNQHGCGTNSKVNCEVVLQYMCSDTADPYVADFWPYTTSKSGPAPFQAFHFDNHRATPRDGVPRDEHDDATDTIPDTEDAAVPDTREDRRFGMHESFAHYELCQHTERNKGLYAADQRVRRNDMRGTRQNPNGDRRGLECPEERDYYPHWAPSPWIDVAVLTNDAQEDVACVSPDDPACSNRCRYYLENSFNKHAKGYCDVDHDASSPVTRKTESEAWRKNEWHNNPEACLADGFVWYNVSLSDLIEDLDYPFCAKTQFARVNQLGNAVDPTVDATISLSDDETSSSKVPHGVNANRLLWTVPRIPRNLKTDEYYKDGNDMDEAYGSCTLRIRYNISTSDFPAWPPEAMDDAHPWKFSMVTAANNSRGDDDTRTTPLAQDPYVYLGAGDDDDDMFVSLAVNTNQYARTFQDRTYSFTIAKRPTEAKPADPLTDAPAIPQALVDALSSSPSAGKVYNVGVRGKRGNIVQTYPAVEYDYTPNSLALNPLDVVHFQWTGSDYNPRRGCNDAEGGPPDPNDFVTSSHDNSRADRSNLVFLHSMAENVPRDMAGYAQATRSSLDATTRVALSKDAVLRAAPCAVCESASECSDAGAADEAQACVDLVRRLAFLNQQSDGGALELRQNRKCLTEAELDLVESKAERENHPLNCAKLNAKPFPYFDAGFLVARRAGLFAFFSSRNNNFSNRDQTGILCVRAQQDDDSCPTDASTGVLQDANPSIEPRAAIFSDADKKSARCFATAAGAANAQGASSCSTDATLLTGETQAAGNKDNDAIGDGNRDACDVIFWDYTERSTTNRTVKYLTLAIILLFAGIFGTYVSYFAYNRYTAHKHKSRKFREGDDWKAKKDSELD